MDDHIVQLSLLNISNTLSYVCPCEKYINTYVTPIGESLLLPTPKCLFVITYSILNIFI